MADRGQQSPVPDPAELRRRAEDRLEAHSSGAFDDLHDSPDRLVHELRVHQIELEVQNEELRDAHAKLADSLARFTELFDFAPIGYLVTDRAGTINALNFSAASLLGVERSRLVGRRLALYVAVPHRVALAEMLGRVVLQAPSDRVPEAYELALAREDGEARDARVTMVANGTDSSTVLVAIEDITSRRELEATRRLHEIEAVLRRRFEALDRVSFEMNRYVTERRGVPLSDEVLGDLAEAAREVTAAEVAAIGLVDEVAGAITRCVERGLTSHGAIDWLRASAEKLFDPANPTARTAQYRDADHTFLATAIRNHGRLVGCLCVAKRHTAGDFDAYDRVTLELLGDRIGVGTDSVRLTRETLEAIAARENVLAIVSHDLRGPLSAIRLAAALLTRSETGPVEQYDRQLALIGRAADRMTRLIDDLLQAASIQAGKLAIDTSPEDVLPLVQEEIDANAPLAAERSIHLRADVAPGVPPIRADRHRLTQVLSNLVGNALKFSHEGGDVVVRARAEGDHVCFAVSDSGPGIPEHEVGAIFERYEQGAVGKHRGVGLGLYIAKGIVEAHRGRIWVESKPGLGSTFYFTIPIASAARP